MSRRAVAAVVLDALRIERRPKARVVHGCVDKRQASLRERHQVTGEIPESTVET